MAIDPLQNRQQHPHQHPHQHPPGGQTATPLLLITGFLGSGKTTLLNRWLQTPAPGLPRLGVVVNEFGQVGIDGKLLSGTGIIELANGCVCCARGTELWETAADLVEKAGAQAVIVETSGLSRPSALLVQHELLPPALAQRFLLQGLLCVVDALHLEESLSRRPEVREQIETADRILMSKLDLVSSGVLAQTHALLDELGATHDRVGVSRHTRDHEQTEILRWALVDRRPKQHPTRRAKSVLAENQATPGHPHGTQVAAVSLAVARPLLISPLRQLLDELTGQVLRAKGFVWLHDPNTQAETLHVVQLAGRRIELEPAQPGLVAPGVLVFLGEKLDETALRLRLSACAASGSL